MPYSCMASIAFIQASQLAFSILIVWVGGQVVAQDRGLELENLNSRAQYLRNELKGRPKDFQLLVTLASTLHQLDHSFPDGGSRIPEAEVIYRKAIERAPTKEFASVIEGNLGALLMSAGRLQEALEAMDESIATSTAAGRLGSENNVGALFNKGKALGMLGREAEAQAVHRKVMKLAKGVAAGTWSKACASIKDVTDEELRQMETAATFLEYGTGIASTLPDGQRASKQMAAALLQQEWGWLERIDPADRSWLYFALSFAFDAREQFDKSWEYLEKANRLQKGREGKEHEQDQQLLAVLTSMFRPPKAGRAAGMYESLLAGSAGFPDETPVFVVGMPRSGSTLVEQILASHPQAFGAGEDTALAALLPSLFKVLEGMGGHVSLRAVARIGETYVSEMERRPPFGQQPRRIVDKMLRNAWNVGHISFILPKAKIVWAVRHPLDVVLSCFAQPFEGRGTPWAWDLDDIAHQVEMTHKIMEHWQHILPGKILQVPYEEIVADQEKGSRKLLEHCGLPWDPVVLRFHKKERNVQTASLSQVRKKLYKTSVGKWKKYSKHLKSVRRRLKPLIQAYEKLVPSSTGDFSGQEEL